MSFAQFEDFYEICCGEMEEEEVLLNAECRPEETTVMANDVEIKKWWEEVLEEIERECENEYELYPV